MKLPVYVDLDDVLADTTRSLVEIARHQFEKNVRFEDVVSFDLKTSFHLTEEEFAQFFHMAHQPDVLLAVSPIPGAIAVLEQWIRAGCEISIVTGRPAMAYAPSIDWLARHRVPYHHFLIVDKYARDGADRNSAMSLDDFAREKFCLAIEDSAAMAGHLSNQMGVPVAMLQRPWNRNARLSKNVRRYSSWEGIQDAFPAPS